MDILTDLNRRLHGLRADEYLTVECADLVVWRDEIKRLREIEVKTAVPSAISHIHMSVTEEKILIAVSARGDRGITCDHLIREVYNGENGGPDSARNLIRVYVYKVNVKIRPLGYEINSRKNTAMRYKLVKL
jgi:hypothetical protein